MRRLILTSLFVACVGCTPHEDPDAPTSTVDRVEPGPTPEPTPKPKPVPVDVAIASAQILGDCPDTPPARAPAPAAVPAAKVEAQRGIQRLPEDQDVAMGDMADPPPGEAEPVYPPVCAQSWLQLSFTSRATSPIAVSIRKATLLSAGGKTLSLPLQTRAPSVWDSTHGYLPWDETLPPGESKASYKLGAKDWAAVETGAENGAYYEVEIEIDVGGERRTLTSSILAKEPEENIVT